MAAVANRETGKDDRAAIPGVRAFLRVSNEVAGALREGRPVVALESTLISHGFPYPENLAIARDSEDAIRAQGAVPATVAIHDGRLLVGLEPSELETLATVHGVSKVARPTLAAALARDGWGATTVSATMIAAHAAGIAVFATGGIGACTGARSWGQAADREAWTSPRTSTNSAGRPWSWSAPGRS